MSRWRIAVVLFLMVVPFAALAGFGSYYLWDTGRGLYVWWPMTFLASLGYFLGWHWSRKRQLLHPVDFAAPLHWTERDHQAWRLVEARAEKAANIEPDKLTNFDFYIETGKEMAHEMAHFYHPGVQNPFDSLTIPEILAVVELASHDMAEMVDRYLPAGHLLTIQNWRQAQKATEWYQTASNIYWLVSAVFSPINTGLRFAASRMGTSKPFQMLQQNLLVWFCTLYIHRLGSYLVDLNSGRLQVGARRFQALKAEHVAPLPSETTEVLQPAGADAVPAAAGRVTLTIFGQVKAGKSSFINALLGEQRAIADVLPATAEVARYELQPAGIPARLVLLDTVGYGHVGPKADQVQATRTAAQQSDLLLLIMHARNPARQADLEMLTSLRNWYAEHPELKMPPILGVITHIDLLTPAMEWSPPYNWQQPQRLKEQQIQQAVAATMEQLKGQLIGVVPVCTASGKVLGINEWLLPAVAEMLDEVHAVALLRCLRAEADVGKVRKVFIQLLETGKQVLDVLAHISLGPTKEPPKKT